MSDRKRFTKTSAPLDQKALFDRILVCEQELRQLFAKAFSEGEMTALSLQTISTSQNQQKLGSYFAEIPAVVVSAGWSTEIDAENSFNNQEFDSAVFFRSSYFKRQEHDHLH